MITAEDLLKKLDEAGLEVTKTENNEKNLGKTPVLCLAEIINELVNPPKP